VFVVFYQTPNAPERNETCTGEHAGLSHTPTETLSLRAGMLDKVILTGENRTDRGPEPLREPEHHGIDMTRKPLGRSVPRDGCVKKPGSVEMNWNISFADRLCRFVDTFGGDSETTFDAVCVL
jgi:hypothetical protein